MESAQIEKEIKEIREDFHKDLTDLRKRYDERIIDVYESLRTYDDIIRGKKISLGAIRDIKRSDITKGVEKVLVPVKKEFAESVEMIRKLSEDLEDVDAGQHQDVSESLPQDEVRDIPDSEPMPVPPASIQPVKQEKKNIDSLFELIARKGAISPLRAATELNIHRIQVDEWSKTLRKHRLIEVSKDGMLKKRTV